MRETSTVSASDPFYMPEPSLFGHADAFHMYTTYAAKLGDAELTEWFPEEDVDLRNCTIELLAECHPVEELVETPDLIREAIEECQGILSGRRKARG